MIEKLKQINLNTLLMIAIVIIVLFYLKQCNRSSNLNDELTIANMNQAALTDSVTTYKDKSGDLTFQKSTLIASEKELKDLNRELYDEVKDLKDNPKIVIKTLVKIIHDTVEVETNTVLYADGSIGLNWNRDTTFSVGNYQKLSGETRFKLDSNKVTDVRTMLNTNEFGMSFITGLKEGKDNYEIFIKSDYPGFVATDIQGAIIDKKMIQSNESSWVFGPQLGYGIVFSNGTVGYGVTVGVGVTYNLNKSIKKLFRPYGL
jgi:hypothetical protein